MATGVVRMFSFFKNIKNILLEVRAIKADQKKILTQLQGQSEVLNIYSRMLEDIIGQLDQRINSAERQRQLIKAHTKNMFSYLNAKGLDPKMTDMMMQFLNTDDIQDKKNEH